MSSLKYYSIYNDLKTKIITGEYKSGEKLLSKRVAADMYGVSVITVEKAYNMLEDEGYVISKQRRGYYVSDAYFPLKTGDNLKKYPHIKEENTEYEGNLEISVWFKTVRRVMSEKKEKLFIPCKANGTAKLRNAIADYLLRYRNMSVNPGNIIIGSGSSQLYETAAELLGKDKIYGIEDPCYHQIPLTYKGIGVKCTKLKIGKDGIIKSELKKDFSVLHVTPFNSFPTGVTTSLAKRKEYIDRINEKNGYIIEDDFSSEFFKPGHPIETLFSLNSGKRVIYMNTFSKSISPSIRIGYMILPDELTLKYNEIFGKFPCFVPVMDQYVLAEFISSGSFLRHLNRARRKLRKNQE